MPRAPIKRYELLAPGFSTVLQSRADSLALAASSCGRSATPGHNESVSRLLINVDACILLGSLRASFTHTLLIITSFLG